MHFSLEGEFERKLLAAVAGDPDVQQFLGKEFQDGSLGLPDAPAVVYDQRSELLVPKIVEQNVRESLSKSKLPLPDGALATIYADAMGMEDELTDSIKAYRAKTGATPSTETEVESQGPPWKTLNKFVDRVEQAKEQYSGKNNEGLKKIRLAFRKLSEHAASAKSFTALLPTQSNYGSVLFGGSVILLEAAHQVGQTRKEIIDALERIPRILCETDEAVDLYKHDERMHRACARLYEAVLRGFVFVVDWFRKSAIKKIVNALAKQTRYTVDGIGELLKCIQDRQAEFQRRLESLQRSETRQIRDMQEVLLDRSAPIDAAAINVMTKATIMVGAVLYDAIKNGNSMKQPSQGRPEVKESLSARRIYKSLRRFGVDASIARTDYLEAVEVGDLMCSKDHRKVAEVLVDTRTISWFKDPATNILLVNGHSATDSHTPSTTLASKIIQALEIGGKNAESPVVILTWYCGNHFILDEEDAHPQGMAVHLLSQLVAAVPKVNFNHMPRSWRKFDPASTKSILDMIELVISAISPKARIFIVLDAVCTYEDVERRKAMLEVVDRLINATRAGKGPAVKIFMTSVRTTNHIYKKLDSRLEVIDMY